MLDKSLYTTREIKEFSDFVYYDKKLPEPGGNPKWIFRGQRCHEGEIDLMPSLERTARAFNGKSLNALFERMPCFECWEIREFKRRLHYYTADVPASDDKLEWLALMQHHGAPTRLLDWTYSFFVSAYFAVEPPANCDYEVWALNASYFGVERSIPDFEQIREAVKCAPGDHIKEEDRAFRFQDAIVNHLWHNPTPCVCAVNPARLNERAAIQQGLFLFPGDIRISFEDNIQADVYRADSSKSLVKFTIDKELRSDILEWLYPFNITEASLFPGLDGFARSFKTRLEFLPKMAEKQRCLGVDGNQSLMDCCSRLSNPKTSSLP